MSNLKTARSAILAELRHVEKGVAYYQNRASALRAALEQLDSTENPAAQPVKKTKSRQTPASAERKARNSTSSKHSLPKTSQEFWLGFISAEPKTAAAIGHAAVASLGLTSAPDLAKKLKSRLAPTLQALVKAKKIKDQGSGRERKFYRATESRGRTAKGKRSAATGSPAPNGLTNDSATHH